LVVASAEGIILFISEAELELVVNQSRICDRSRSGLLIYHQLPINSSPCALV